MATISEMIKEKAIIYIDGIDEVKGQKPNDMLIDFVIEKYKQHRNYPKTFSEEKIEADMVEHLSTMAMAVVDMFMKTGAEGEKSHKENNISREYENAYISISVFNDVLPYVNIL